VCKIHDWTSERIVCMNNRGCWLDVCLCRNNSSHNFDRLNAVDHLRYLQLRQRSDLLLGLIVILLMRSRVPMLRLLTFAEVLPVMVVLKGIREFAFHQFTLSLFSYH
jgi:hypothetical protein